ncbi:MAG: DUF4428 domain-containing protein [Eubacteriales bacterium]|nr:DUF4428 domain-containing protein [Eubacteriales bacterium]
MGLFDRKYCDICGDKIGLLGNKKLADGNCCKKCEAKLSYWFNERKQSTVEDIKEQLAYREANLEKVRAFHATRTLGRGTVVCLDEDKQQFMVMRTGNKENENPDVLDFSQVTGCDLQITENVHTDEPIQEEGKPAKLPKQYYSYTFRMIIQVDHPYFSEMAFDLNNSSIRIESQATNVRSGGFVRETVRTGSAAQSVNAKAQAAAQKAIAAKGGKPSGTAAPAAKTTYKPATPQVTFVKVDPATNAQYCECKRTGTEIKRALLAARMKGREEAAPKKAVTCPYCGATTMPDANGCCEYCGGAVN